MTAESQTPILVVDGNDTDRARLSGLLQRAGFATRDVRSGDDVVDAVAEHLPAVVVLEVALPGLNGYEVCRRLRDTYGATMPIVFVSGTRTEALDRVAGLLVGADDYIVKPFDPAELIARVRRLARGVATNGKPAPRSAGLELLTAREREVLKLLSEGFRQSEIAHVLVISPRTVATHIQRVLKKLNVNDRTQAVALVLRPDALDAQANGA